MNVYTIRNLYTESNFINYAVDYNEKEKAIAYIETNLSSGSGFMISSNGLCLTCFHVVKNADKILVRLICNPSSPTIYHANIIYHDEDADLAILKLENCNNVYFYSLEKDFSNIHTGDDIAVFGFPFGRALNEDIRKLEPSLTKGYISSKNKIREKECYYLDVRAAEGNSGSPVFSLKTAKVIGYLCGSYGSAKNNLIYIHTLELFWKLIDNKHNYINDAFCDKCVYRNECDTQRVCATKEITKIIDSIIPSERKIIYSLLDIETVKLDNFKMVAKEYNLDEFDIRQKVAKVQRRFMRTLQTMSNKEKETFLQPIILPTDNNEYARLIKLFNLLKIR